MPLNILLAQMSASSLRIEKLHIYQPSWSTQMGTLLAGDFKSAGLKNGGGGGFFWRFCVDPVTKLYTCIM
jgi:hypothetical protein